MPDEDARLQSYFRETAQRADRQNRTLFTHFLNLAQLDLLSRMLPSLPVTVTLWGGHELCERKMAAFGSPPEIWEWPMTTISAAPLQQKFAQELSHRDFLGAVLGLGIKRETVGDIFVRGSAACIVTTDVMGAYITEHLTQVSRTDIHCEAAPEIPPDFLPRPVPRRVNVPSPRLDALVGAAFHLSRSQSAELIARGRVFLNARLTENSGKEVPENAVVSVRGFGRFRYIGVDATTKKERLFVTIETFE